MQRQVFNDVLEPTPNSIAEFEEKQREKLTKQYEAGEAAGDRYRAESRRLLIELADAWGAYTADSSHHNKLRVQAIVGALPTNFARAIGYAVDVPRDFWGEHQWPFEEWVEDQEKGLIRENAPMIELIWNLRQVQIPVFVEADLSQRPDPWPRIERAIYGFRDLVRQRESGNRESRDGELDRKSKADVQQRVAEVDARRGEIAQ
jgi:hypothetical protein